MCLHVFLPPIMPGSTRISGHMPCSQQRVLDPKKPCTFSFNAELVLGHDENGDAVAVTAFLTHFHAPTAGPLPDGALYFISGKVATIDEKFSVGAGFSWSSYLCVIDADKAHSISPRLTDLRSYSCSRWNHCLKIPSTGRSLPLSVLSVVYASIIFPFHDPLLHANQAGQQTAPRDFLFDIRDYVAGGHRVIHFKCTIPTSNHRFTQASPLPGNGRLVQTVGAITGSSIEEIAGETVKRLSVELTDIQYLGADGPPPNALPVSGQSLTHTPSTPLWLTSRLGPPAKYGWKRRGATSAHDNNKRKPSDAEEDDSPPQAGPSKEPRRRRS